MNIGDSDSESLCIGHCMVFHYEGTIEGPSYAPPSSFLPPMHPTSARPRCARAILRAGLLDMAPTAETLQVALRPRVAALVERPDMVYLIPIAPADCAAPASRIEHPSAQLRPSANMKAKMI